MTARIKPTKKKQHNKPRRHKTKQADPHTQKPPRQRKVFRSDGQVLPILRFSPYAWSKLLFLRDQGETEVGGFGISSPDDVFLIEDFRLIKQRVTWASVEFDDEAVADFFDEQVDQGRFPEHFGRHWIHTHPGDCAQPSSTDENTFTRVFSQSSWSVMIILARGGETYSRLKFGCGPGAELLVPVGIAWDIPFAETDHEAWEEEYNQCVHEVTSIKHPQQQFYHPYESLLCEEELEQLHDWDFIPLEEHDEWERSSNARYESL